MSPRLWQRPPPPILRTQRWNLSRQFWFGSFAAEAGAKYTVCRGTLEDREGSVEFVMRLHLCGDVYTLGSICSGTLVPVVSFTPHINFL